MSGRSPRRELVFLGHAVDRSGPPIYLLHLLRWLARHQAMRPTVVSLEAGELVEEYRAVSDLVVVGEPDPVRVSRGSRP